MAEYTPMASSSNMVCEGNVRFTFLTDRFVRMEWAADGCFEDRATLAVVNRKMPRVDFAAATRAGKLTIKTEYLTIVYSGKGKKFNKNNLKISFKSGGKSGRWAPGTRDKKNLKGTYRTLDCYLGDRDRDGRKIPLCDGLLSPSGWSFFDDSGTVALDENIADQPWPAARADERKVDMYFMAYGLDYRQALADAAKVYGHQPLPPRFALGYWWSRYWEYNDKELEEVVHQFDSHGVPLDVLVIDMDWHKDRWTGYSWDRRLFPDPEEFLGWLKSRDLKITLNLHPADGVGRHEDQFEDMARAMDMSPAKCECVEFDCTDPKFVDAYFKILHHPQEDMGVDFWWMDWQQGTQTKLPSLDPLSWLNHLHYVDMQQRTPQRRPLIFSRFGGLGAGRYPVGFSGDTYINWKSLAYQPYFTATASNVLYGYWSHDIGGHHLGELNAELYTRWIQFGIFSPIFRTHTSKNPDYERRVWSYPEPYSRQMLDAINRRYEMVPYIYTECHKAIESGLSLCRPMYYEYPKLDESYAAKDQYFFGDEMLVAPVVAPASEKDEMTEVSVWLPAGKWFDSARCVWEKGGQTIKRKYMAAEIPVFVRPGAIIPGQQAPKRLTSGSYKDLLVTAYPGGDGSYELYEDDGVTQGYVAGEFATIKFTQKDSKTAKTITVKKSGGDFKGFLKTRSLEVRLPAAANVESVEVDGKKLDYAYRLGDEGWKWDAGIGGVIIKVKKINVESGAKVKLSFSGKPDAALGMAGAFIRLERIRQLGSRALLHRQVHPLSRVHADTVACGTRIELNPETIDSERRKLKKMLKDLPVGLKWRLDTTGAKHLAKDAIKKATLMVKELTSWFK